MAITSIRRETDRSFSSLSSLVIPKIPNVYTFDSRSEAVCAIILEKYIPNWKVNRGESWQIPLPTGKVADFKVGNAIIEFHPIDLKFELGNSAFCKFKIRLKSLNPEHAKEYENSMKEKKLADYSTDRQELLLRSKELRNCHLYVCCNDESFSNTVSILARGKFSSAIILNDWRETFRSL